MPTYTVGLDTIKLQTEFDNELEQNEVQRKMIAVLRSMDGGLWVKSNYDNKNLAIHTVMKFNRRILEIKTGCYMLKSNNKKKKTFKYYISIEIAGLKSYIEEVDTLSYSCLIRVCAFLNTNSHKFIYTGLDVYVDLIDCKMFRVFVFCNKKAAGVKYYKLGESQPYISSKYIEKYNRTHKHVMRRSYWYSKSEKENLKGVDITRFEVKLQSRYFSKNHYNIDTIHNNLERYHILYFPTADDRMEAIERYRVHEDKVRRRDLYKLGLDKYRIHPDTSELNDFLLNLYTIYEYQLNLPVIPTIADTFFDDNDL